MHKERLAPTLHIFALLILVMFGAAACDPDQPPATPTPIGPPSPTVPPSATPTSTYTATPSATPTLTPTPTETPQPTFISVPGPQPTAVVRRDEAVVRQQLAENRAKWRDQNVLEYELLVKHESVAPFAGVWLLLVKPDSIQTLSYSPLNVITPTTPPAGMSGELLRFLTVDELFKSVEFRINEQYGPALEARADYVASFEPNLGYPTLVQIKPKRGNDLASSTRVERLTIIRRAIVTPSPTSAPSNTPVPTPADTPIAPLATPTSLASPTRAASPSPLRTGTPSPGP